MNPTIINTYPTQELIEVLERLLLGYGENEMGKLLTRSQVDIIIHAVASELDKRKFKPDRHNKMLSKFWRSFKGIESV